MHIAEGFLPPVQAALWGAAAAPFIVHGARSVIKISKEHPQARLLLGAAGAFTFVLSAIKMPSVTGSSSHPTGTGAGAILFKPPVMAFMATIVLLFQALLLAHGGLSTLGANVFSMGVVGPWVAYGIWKLLQGVHAPRSVGVFLAMAAANLSTYCVTAFQLALAFPDPESGLMGAALKFLSLFAVTQIPLSIAEGILGVLLFRALESLAAKELDLLGFFKPAAKSQLKEQAHA